MSEEHASTFPLRNELGDCLETMGRALWSSFGIPSKWLSGGVPAARARAQRGKESGNEGEGYHPVDPVNDLLPRGSPL